MIVQRAMPRGTRIPSQREAGEALGARVVDYTQATCSSTCGTGPVQRRQHFACRNTHLAQLGRLITLFERK
jgi:hypothetical protein